MKLVLQYSLVRRRGLLKCDGTRAETRFRLSAKRTSPFKSAGASVQSTTGSRGVRMDTPRSEVVRRVLATHSIRQFLLHFPSRASPCAITFQLESTNHEARHAMFSSSCYSLSYAHISSSAPLSNTFRFFCETKCHTHIKGETM